MFIEERTCNGDSMDCSLVALCADGAALNGYAFGFGGDNTDGNLGVSSAEELRTYKRRKQSRLSSESSLQEDGRGSEGAAGQLPGQTIKKPGDMVAHKNSLEQDGLSRIVCPVLLDGIDDCPHGHWRRVVLEEISQSLGVSEGGIHRCIREAIMHSQFRYGNMPKVQNATEQTAWNQESAKRHGDSQKLHSQLNSTTKIPDRKQNFAKGHVDASPVGSQNETSDRIHVHHNTELCQQVFHKVIISEKFALLCKLLCENFQGVKVDSFFDFSIINSRMKEGAYEQSPVLFCADIQQVWGKFQRIGAEMVSLAKSLSDLSRTSYREKVGGLVNGAYEEGKFEVNNFLLLYIISHVKH
uniref:Uncharacterized protein n=1 Tax=Nelumbo nucifera TaxID=4432 RepID=A0A822XZT7_NELNU|nr:TPA_asm: hypothetical protein HUJ06_026185 [Nelumbo nucifera]